VSTLIAGALARPGGHVRGWIELAGERIAAVGSGPPPRPADVEHSGFVAPGLCDLQVNGAVGVEVTDGPAALDRIDAFLLSRGVTAYLPTVISTDPQTAARAVAELAERAADPDSPVVGVHLEGPYLSPEFHGVHRREHLLRPDAPTPPYYHDDCVRLVTLAPELPGAMELIGELAARGVTVSLGHSGACPEVAAEALERGARCVTHLFNAMRPMHHRDPGLAGWALVEERVHIGVIADGLHVAPMLLTLIGRLAEERVVLVSDSSPVAGADAGHYRLAGVEIERASDGGSRTPAGGLAGGTVTLDELARRWAGSTGVSVPHALVAAGERPGRLIGLDVGLRPGASADLVLTSPAGEVERVMRRGSWVSG
jgi:N-acetylglucosamine-6-phosphate deacetylase